MVSAGQKLTVNAPSPSNTNQVYQGYTFEENESIRGADKSVSVTIGNESKAVYF